jgi:hypothetical protein
MSCSLLVTGPPPSVTGLAVHRVIRADGYAFAYDPDPSPPRAPEPGLSPPPLHEGIYLEVKVVQDMQAQSVPTCRVGLLARPQHIHRDQSWNKYLLTSPCTYETGKVTK